MESWQAKLGDFGVVRFLPSAETTMTTRVVGTLVYMAPEYTKGMITPAADVYAFGVVRLIPASRSSLTCLSSTGQDLTELLLNSTNCDKNVDLQRFYLLCNQILSNDDVARHHVRYRCALILAL